MIRIREAIIVEGRYDKNTLAQIVDAPILETSGFGIFHDRQRLALLRRLAEENRIPWQTKHRVAGGTDARTIQRSREGVRAAGLAVAVRNIHSPSSVASIEDCENMLKLARLFIVAVAEEC